MGVEDHVDVSGMVRPAPPAATRRIDDPQGGGVVEQDIANITLQRGMYSRGLNGTIVYSEQERRIQHFLAELDLYLDGKKG